MISLMISSIWSAKDDSFMSSFLNILEDSFLMFSIIISFSLWLNHNNCIPNLSLYHSGLSWKLYFFFANYLMLWLSVRLRTKWLWVWVLFQSLKLQISYPFRARSSLTFRQLYGVDLLWNAYSTWQEHTVQWIVQITTQNTTQSFSKFYHLVDCVVKN